MAASGTKDPAPDNSDILKGRRNTMDSDHIYQRIKSMTNEDRAAMAQVYRPSDESELESVRGDGAARRRAVLDLLFFCCAGDVERSQEIVRTWGIDVSDPKTCDYDKRYPLHLAASEGCFRVVHWLIEQGADVNVIDRFKHTPLEDAITGDHGEVAKLLMQAGGMVMHNGRGNFEADMDWEVNPENIILGQVIGKGEFGTVYKATWHNSVVAIKVLNSSSEVAKGELRSELNTLRKAHHPHTVQCLGAVTSKEPYMIITEYMPCGSLDDIFQKNINLGVRRFAELALHTARGMAYLHQRQPNIIIHRDLKPANIMIGSSPYVTNTHKRLVYGSLGVAKIADFGLCKTIPLEKRINKAKQTDDGGPGKEMLKPENTHGPSYHMTGETGSYRYMAPEVFRHEPYNRKVDVYSFGMIAYYLFTGLPPMFEQDAVKAAQLAALHGVRPAWPSPNRWGTETPEALKALVEKCWDPKPENRPEFTEICEQLCEIILTLPEVKHASVATGCSCSLQ